MAMAARHKKDVVYGNRTGGGSNSLLAANLKRRGVTFHS